jgi:hypothetical protein
VKLVNPEDAPITENIQQLRNELLPLVEHSEDEVLLAEACLTLRGEADVVIRNHSPE